MIRPIARDDKAVYLDDRGDARGDDIVRAENVADKTDVDE